jgi:hypothetical protein
MATSEVQICNIALGKLGVDFISSLEEDSKAGKHCALFYGPCRDSVLAALPWNFAVKRAALARLATDPAFGYSYQYQKPANCIRVLQLVDPTSEFSIEGTKVLCDVLNASCFFIERITNVTFFSPGFVMALAAKLASELANPLTGELKQIQAMQTLYENQLAEAAAVDSAEGLENALEKNTWLEARGITVGTQTPILSE